MEFDVHCTADVHLSRKVEYMRQTVARAALSLALCLGVAPAGILADEAGTDPSDTGAVQPSETPEAAGEPASQDGTADPVPADGETSPDIEPASEEEASPAGTEVPAEEAAPEPDVDEAPEPDVATTPTDASDPNADTETAETDVLGADALSADAAAPDEPAAEAAGGTFSVEETCAVDPGLPGNDALFDGYVYGLLYGNSGVATLGDYYTEALNEQETVIYQALLERVEQVAQGGATSTADIEVTLEGLSWTHEELGVDGSDGETLSKALSAKLAEAADIHKVLTCLMADHPYELYWYDKSVGVSYSYSYTSSTDSDRISIGTITFTMAVAKGYSDDMSVTTSSGKTILCGTDPDRISEAQSAVATAQAIVADYAGKSDREILEGYKNEICARVSYNSGAADNDSTPYGDPWQIIYVFDDDPDTNVVCEGYAKAFQYLCDLTTFSDDTVCYTVSGTMTGGTGAGAHMWNVVAFDGGRYLVDVTNSDAGTIGADGSLFLALPEEDGSVESGYTFSTTSGTDVSYAYSAETLALYNADTVLTLKAPAQKASLEGATVRLADGASFTYNGAAQTPTPDQVVVTLADGTVVPSGQYTVTAGNNVDAGEATITVTAIPNGDYTGSVTGTFTIAPKQLTDPIIEVATDDLVYDGQPKEPAVTVYDGDTVVPASEYTVAYSSNVNAGTGTVAVSDKEGGNYVVSGSATFTIAPAPQSELTVTGQPEGTIRYGDTFQLGTEGGSGDGAVSWAVTAGADYATVAEDGTVTVTGVGPFTVTTIKAASDNYAEAVASLNFDDVAKAPLTVTDVTLAPKTYDGTASATVKDVTVSGMRNGDALVYGTDFYVSSATYDSADAGNGRTATVTVALSGSAAGNYELTDNTFTRTGQVIEQADWQGTATAASSARFGATGTCDLSGLLPAGSVLGTPTVGDGENIFATDSLALDGTMLTYTVADDEGLAGMQGTVAIPVTGTNYKPFTLTVTVTVTDKTAPVLGVDPIVVTYTGEPISANLISGTATVDGQEIEGTWSFADGQAITNVADSGSKTVVFTPADTDAYASVEASVPVTIERAPQELHIVGVPEEGLYYGETFQLSVETNAEETNVLWSVGKGNPPLTMTQDGTTASFKVRAGGTSATISVESTGGANYEPARASVEVDLLKVPLTVSEIQLAPKTYDGTTDATVTAASVEGVLEGDEVAFGTDFVVASAVYDSPDAGTDRTATITFAMNGPSPMSAGYELVNPYTLTGQTIAPSEAAPDESVTAISIALDASGSCNLGGSLPAGAVLGTELTVDDPSGIFATAPAIDENGTLTYELSTDPAAAGKTATITIPVTSSANYSAPFNLTLTATAPAVMPEEPGTDEPGETPEEPGTDEPAQPENPDDEGDNGSGETPENPSTPDDEPGTDEPGETPEGPGASDGGPDGTLQDDEGADNGTADGNQSNGSTAQGQQQNQASSSQNQQEQISKTGDEGTSALPWLLASGVLCAAGGAAALKLQGNRNDRSRT